MRILPSALTVLLLTGSSAAIAKPLTMRSAERAIDLGLEAELAGDAAGAERSLLELIRSATTAEEVAPRERIESFVRSLEERRAAFAKHGKTAPAYASAYDSMLPFGLERAERLWTQAAIDLPQLASASMPAVAVRLELAKGIDRRAAMQQLERTLQRYGLAIAGEESARFVVRVNVDATGVKRDPRGVRVSAEASAVVNDRLKPKRAAGSVAKRRAERRRREADARRFALYRVLDDVGRRVVFAVRARMLEDAGPPT